MPSGRKANRKPVLGTGKCPKGHQLPHLTNKGRCTPLYCATENEDGVGGASSPRKGVKKTAALKRAERKARTEAIKAASEKHLSDVLPDGDADALAVRAAKAAADIQKADEIGRIGHAAGRLAARKAYLNYPEQVENPEEFVTKRQVAVLPDAMAEIEFQLKFGDDKQRMEAAVRVLDATGFGKKEATNGGGNSIVIINAGGGAVSAPWRTAKTIEGVVNRAQIEAGAVEGCQAAADVAGGGERA